METTLEHAGESAVLAVLRSGDQAAFGALTERYRRQLHVHCYRMLGSFDDAEDTVQETLLRAWRSRHDFQGRSLFRTWLYRIATNVCLNALDSRSRRILPSEVAPPTDASSVDVRLNPDVHPEMAWLQPYPDNLLDEAAAEEPGPDTLAVSRETIELAYLAAVQHLPPRQRAILILRDALGWSEKETASLLETSVASVKSALTRAHGTMRDNLPSHRTEWSAPAPKGVTAEERSLVAQFMAAYDRSDASALTNLLCQDARQTMPPALMWFDGRGSIVTHHAHLLDGTLGEFRLVPMMANRQPAFAAYLRAPRERRFHLSGVNVLRVEGGRIAEITSFGRRLCAAFELPETI